jgi:hypothetical protein
MFNRLKLSTWIPDPLRLIGGMASWSMITPSFSKARAVHFDSPSIGSSWAALDGAVDELT